MSQVNELLCLPGAQDIVWKALNLSSNCSLPIFSEELIYGALSHVMHNPRFVHLIISNQCEPKLEEFLRMLADKYSKEICYFDEESASAYEIDEILGEKQHFGEVDSEETKP